MNPQTGTFHTQEEIEALAAVQSPGDPHPLTWPVFRIGEQLEIKGVPFELIRINRSNLVLRPIVAGKASAAIDKMTG